MIRVLVADDEPIARSGMRALLAEEPDVTVVGEARNGRQALERISELRPDLVLLDINMPDVDGMSVARQLHGGRPVIVFVTAHDEHAVEAFDLAATDYVLKPFERRRFHLAIARARERLLNAGQPAGGAAPDRDRLVVRDRDRLTLVRVPDVSWVEARGNYVRIHIRGRFLVMRETLNSMEERLRESGFVRISRSIVANAARITELRLRPNGTSLLILEDGARLESSRRYRRQVEGAVAAARRGGAGSGNGRGP